LTGLAASYADATGSVADVGAVEALGNVAAARLVLLAAGNALVVGGAQETREAGPGAAALTAPPAVATAAFDAEQTLVTRAPVAADAVDATARAADAVGVARQPTLAGQLAAAAALAGETARRPANVVGVAAQLLQPGLASGFLVAALDAGVAADL